MGSLGTVYLDVKFNPEQVGSALKQGVVPAATKGADAASQAFTDRLGATATNFTRAGRQLTFGLTVPLVAAGKLAANAFLPFEENLGHIQGLTGTTAAETRAFGQTILNTSANFGVMAGEAAGALYFITSSGIKGSAAIDTLNASMTATQAGLGDVTTVADFATSAMNSYSKEGLTASRATDVLTAAVREGKAEPAEFASAIGQVIPIAAALGVPLDQVAGSMAALTKNGVSASTAAVQIAQVLTTIQNPSAEAKQALIGVQGGWEGLQDTLKNEGILPTLQKISTGLDGNSEAMGNVFGNIRALRGALALLNGKQTETADLLDRVDHSAGDTNKAAEVMAGTLGGQLKQATAAANTELVKIGEAIVPLGIAGVKAAGGLAGAFANLPTPIRATAIGLLGVGAAAGPVTYTLGGIARAASGVGKGIEVIGKIPETVSGAVSALTGATRAAGGFGSSLAAIAGPAAAVTAAVVALTITIKAYQDSVDEASRSTDDLLSKQARADASKGLDASTQLQKRIDDARKVANAANAGRDNSNPLLYTLPGIGQAAAVRDKQSNDIADKQVDSANKSITAAMAMQEQQKEIAKAYGVSEEAAGQFVLQQDAVGTSFGSTKDAVDAYGKTMGATADVTKSAATSLGALSAASKNAQDSFFGLQQAQRNLDDAQAKVGDAQRSKESAIRGLSAAQRDEAKSLKAITDAERERTRSAQKVTDALEAQKLAQKNLDDLLNGNAGKSDQLDLESAKLDLADAKRALTPKGGFDKTDPNAKARAEIAFKRAQIALDRAQEAHDKNVLSAQKDLRNANDAVTDAKDAQRKAQDAVTDAQQAHTDATYKTQDAQVALYKAVQDVGRAQEDVTAQAANLSQKQEAFTAALAGANGQGPAFIKFLEALKDTYPLVADEIQKSIDKFDEVAKGPNGIAGKAHGGWDKRETRHAHGGWMQAGEVSTVNELGAPELFEAGGRQYIIPTSSGYVRAAGTWEGDVKGGDGGHSVNVGDIYVTAPNPKRTAYELRRELRKKSYLAGGK